MITLHGWTDERRTEPIEVRVNPAQICFYRRHTKGGTRIFFATDAILDVSEDLRTIDHLIAPKAPL